MKTLLKGLFASRTTELQTLVQRHIELTDRMIERANSPMTGRQSNE